jgi:integrase
MPLTDVSIRTVKPSPKTARLFDGGGLYLEISPKGGKWWRLKYRFNGKEKRLSFGVYPTVSLKDAREKRDEAKKLLSNGVDPSENRKAIKAARTERAANTFEVIAREYFSKPSPKRSQSHSERIIRQLEIDIFPWIGERPIPEVTPSELLTVIQRIEKRGVGETAHRVLQSCGQVFRYAIVTARTERDPTISLKGALSPVKENHFAAITEPKAIGELLRAIEGYQGYPVIKSALRLAPLVFVRPGELRMAEWTEIDLDRAEWNIPAERMKMKQPHLVPLSQQAIAIFRELHPMTGHRRFVFPSVRSPNRPMSNNAILAALRRMGYTKDEMSGHGFRAMARTVLDEVLGVRPDFIEHQLAHAVRDPNGRAYNRTAHLAERRKMMQRWADYLEDISENSGNIIAGKFGN